MRYRVAIRFAIEGDLRFISHHDTMRLFERAIARAGLPVKFSEGFNPRPRFSLPLPRPVGIASQADLIVIDLAEPSEPGPLMDRLGSQMPGGLRLVSAWSVEGSRSLQPALVTCECPLPPDTIAGVTAAVERLLHQDEWLVRRDADSGAAPVDLRALLVDASTGDGRVRWSVRVTNGGTVRPAEFLSAIGLNPQDELHHVRRVEVQWTQDAPEPVLAAAGDTPDDPADAERS